jgi:hypothetical protein
MALQHMAYDSSSPPNPQRIRWVHDQILRNDYGAVSLVTITDANAQQYLPAEARILVAK